MDIIKVRLILITLLLSTAFCKNIDNSPPVNSELDQYEEEVIKREGSHPSQPLTEATDHPLIFQLLHRFYKKNSLDIKKYELLHRNKAAAVPELQVGCGEGILKTENVKSGKGKERELKYRRKRSPDARTKRGFYPYPGQVIQAPPIQSFTYFDPPAYQIQRPYIIPVWGAPNRVPIYFPPQPVYTNPGFPPHNPMPNRGYLPVPPPDSSTMPTFENRFPSIYEDRPVWGTANDIPNTPVEKPTRRPRPIRPTTAPPLLHRNDTDVGNEMSGIRPQIQTTTIKPTQRPRPPPSTTAQPTPSFSGGLSQCVWATVSCCSGVNADISYSCFEQLGCTGAFWDKGPCDSDFAKAAIQAALNYYN